MHDNGLPPRFSNKKNKSSVQKSNSRVKGYYTFGNACSLRRLLPVTKTLLISYPDYRFFPS